MKILIVGGGIAGLAMARALELQGFSADLIERRADVPQEGTGLYLPGNASRAAQALGLTGSITRVAMPITTQRILDWSTQRLSTIPRKSPYA